MKRTYQPSRIVRKRRHGFRARMSTKAGRQIIARRRAKGRSQLSAQLGLMAHSIQTINKRSTFVLISNKGKFIRGNTFNLQFLESSELKNIILVGFTATKKLGNAVKRNRAKRIMRELARAVITKYGKKNSYYVLIAKSSIFDTPFESQKIELKKLIS